MSDYLSIIKELITFYIKTNYEQYLVDNEIKTIPTEQIDNVVDTLYTNKKEHLKTFILSSMKELLKDEYPGDLIISNILNDILRDDQLCKRTLINEIDLYQKNNLSKQ
tara:strand:- start:182 stop:505 length:324 start_codon:yes stop_codon:yes gene_type:complete